MSDYTRRFAVILLLAVAAAWPVGCSKGYEPGLGLNAPLAGAGP
jgi:hypothetical protein